MRSLRLPIAVVAAVAALPLGACASRSVGRLGAEHDDARDAASDAGAEGASDDGAIVDSDGNALDLTVAAAIKKRASNGVISIGSSTKYAGAISSLTWGGREFVNDFDHGRQIQVAYQLDGKLECFNPTEAGSAADAKKATSSSRLLAARVAGNIFATSNVPANWTNKGKQPPAGYNCGGGVRTGAVPGHRIDKTVVVGWNNHPNVVQFHTVVTLPQNFSSVGMYAPAIFLQPDISENWLFNPDTGDLAAMGSPSLYDNKTPLIATTPDHRYALGLWAPAPPRAGRNFNYAVSHTVTDPRTGTNSIHAIFTDVSVPAGAYTYDAFLIVGDFQTVRDQMRALVGH